MRRFLVQILRWAGAVGFAATGGCYIAAGIYYLWRAGRPGEFYSDLYASWVVPSIVFGMILIALGAALFWLLRPRPRAG